MITQTPPATYRFSVRCYGCRNMQVIEVANVYDIHGVTCAHCAATMSPRMQGIFKGVTYVYAECRQFKHKKISTPTKCGARCRGACGPNCDCECGGKNHGIDAIRAG